MGIAVFSGMLGVTLFGLVAEPRLLLDHPRLAGGQTQDVGKSASHTTTTAMPDAARVHPADKDQTMTLIKPLLAAPRPDPGRLRGWPDLPRAGRGAGGPDHLSPKVTSRRPQSAWWDLRDPDWTLWSAVL